ncbi:MAG TPA: LD-carboxypeptidase [Vicinamibacterales bacterium]|nr:LD-carboxypeptidase [Vicinamibacterales bacterium]
MIAAETRTAAGRRRPRRLQPGDRVALVAPASPTKTEDLERGADELRALGFEPVCDERVRARHGYVAGLPALRASALADAWRDPAIRGIIAVRGGYGSQQVLPLLDPRWLVADPKVFIGYSDLTALLAWQVTHGLVAFHGPMVEGRLAEGPSGYDRASLLAAVTRPVAMGTLAPASLEVFRPGEAGGVLMGGTMTQLAALLGTPFACIPREPTILFLEDVGERPYRLDRLLSQLHQAGMFRHVTGVLLGVFPGCDESGGGPTARAVLADLFANFPGPVVFGFPSGHTNGPTTTLPLGVGVRLLAGGAPALSIQEPAVY